MAEVKFQLKGWMAVPAILLVVGFVIWRHHALEVALAGDAAEVIEQWLVSEYTRERLPEAKTALAEGRSDRLSEIAKGMIGPDDVELVDPTVKGRGDTVLVRFRVRVRGGDPPVGAAERVFELRHTPATGWRVKREVAGWSWYFKLY